MKLLSGFSEEWGDDALRREYVERVLSDVMRSCNYERISIPVIEPFSSYTEAIVGKSPWPEWNEKCIFKFNINNYYKSYESFDNSITSVCLIPEGTVSITRWLAAMIEAGETAPKRLFYSLKCYRNELISTLTNTKSREFQQFGVEILDSADIQSDIEIIKIVVSLMTALGIKENLIRVRINDVALFNRLVDDCHIQPNDVISLKKDLDYLAECYAGKHSEDYTQTQKSIQHTLSNYLIAEQYLRVWDAIINHSYQSINEAKEIYPICYLQDFVSLEQVFTYFSNCSLKIDLDLSVIRSHQYYSGLSFEVDVVSERERYYEVAGGGRYDRLVGAFLRANDNTCALSIPCTGFAFGMDRIISMAKDLGVLNGKKELYSVFNFK